MKIKIYTDGASRGNPGPASYGFVIVEGSSEVYAEGMEIGITTNNVAEYTGVLESLNYVKNKYQGREAKVELYADSKLVVEQLSGKYRIKAEHLKKLTQKIQILATELGGVLYTHIPRAQNTKADKLANQALDNNLH